MRSEKEIKEKIRKDLTGKLTLEGENQKLALDWVLEGEPRYSIEELSKVFDYLVGGRKSYEWDTAYFIDFLKDDKKVEKILGKKKKGE